MAQKKGKKMSKAQVKAAAAKAAREAKKAAAEKPAEAVVDDSKPAFLRALEDDSLNSNKTRDVHVPNYSMSNPGGGAALLEATDIQLSHAHRYGLVGKNGAGKSTLLRALASYTIPEFPRHLRVLHVKQEFLPSSEQSVRQYVIQADEELTHLTERHAALTKLMEAEGNTDTAKLLDEMDTIQDRLDSIDADSAQTRAAEILVGLQFNETMQNTPTSSLSGGWRMRVSLACALFVQPDLLMLDEPTNHLDMPSVAWLTAYLVDYPKTLIVVSHDRTFLNDVCTDMVLLDKAKLNYYKGDYDTFLRTVEEQRVFHNTMAERNQRIRAKNEHYIRRFKANAKLASQAQSRQKMLDKMEDLEVITDEVGFSFEFPAPTPLKKNVVAEFCGVTFGYHGEDPTRSSYLYNKVNVKLKWGDCIALVGANGTGKSTLIKMMTDPEGMGPVEGRLVMNNSAKFGYFSQHHMEHMDPDQTPFEYLSSVFPNATTQEVMQQIGNYGLTERAHRSKIKELSGGQKSRIAFARLTWENPQVLVLDEPTNHLDFETIDALIKAVKDFPGAVILVSHDQHMLRECVTEYWALADKVVKSFYTFDEAKEHCYRPGASKVEFRQDTTEEVKKYQAELAAAQLAEHADILARMDADRQTKLSKKKAKEAKIVKGPWDTSPIDFDLLDRWLKLDKAPTVVLRSLQGMVPNPNKSNIVARVASYVFTNLFSIDDKIYLKQWAPVLAYCCPLDHAVNQVKLVFMAQGCWNSAVADQKARARRKNALLKVFKELVEFQVIGANGMTEWAAAHGNKTAGREAAMKQAEDWVATLKPTKGGGKRNKKK